MANRKPTEQQAEALYAISDKINWLIFNSHKRGYGHEGDDILEVVDAVAAAMGLPPDYRRHLSEDRLVCPEEIYQAGDPTLADDQR